MDRNYWKELLPIIHAFAEGKEIQFSMNNSEWIDLERKANFDGACKYRIKPTPRLFEILVQNGIVLGASRCGNNKVERIKAIEILE